MYYFTLTSLQAMAALSYGGHVLCYSFLGYATDKQTNKQTDRRTSTFYPRRPTYVGVGRTVTPTMWVSVSAVDLIARAWVTQIEGDTGLGSP